MNTTNKTAKPKKPLLQKLKTIGLIMAGVGAAIIAAPVALPTIVVTIGGYVAVAGGILVASAQPVSAKLKSLFV